MKDFSYNPQKKKPNEKFKNCPNSINQKSISDFWQWGFSDLLQNTTRGILAEYIVAALLDIDNRPRNPWLAYDLILPDGQTIEVKTMSRLQAWAQKKLSTPRIVIPPTRKWDPKTGIMEVKPTYNADLYVFCYFTATNIKTSDPLNLNQWEFYIFTKDHLKEMLGTTKSISLRSLKKKGVKPIKAKELKNIIEGKNASS